jgi:hypothetical protein
LSIILDQLNKISLDYKFSEILQKNSLVISQRQ